MKLLRTTTILTLLLCLPLLAASTASAATMTYGPLMGTDVMYLDTSEDSGPGEPLRFGTPSVSGNKLVFDPTGFQSQTTGPAGSDLIDSTATTIIMANQGQVLNNILFTEQGDYTLSGLPGGQAQSTVGAAFFYTVLEVDNLAVTLPTEDQSMTFTTGSGANGGEYNRPTDDGTTVPWKGTLLIDLDAYLASEGISGSATKVRVRFDNTLSTAADAVSSAFIKKKVTDGVTITTNVPEPTSAMLLLVSACLGLAIRHKS